MMSDSIFVPMLGLMVLTAAVWFYMYALRIPAMRRLGKHAQTYTTPDGVIDNLPEQTNYPAYNLKNLFELPVLFYAVCIYLHVVGAVDTVYVTAAWSFFVLRFMHTVVHCTWNNVMQRFVLYATGALVLWFMIGRAMLAIVIE